MFVDRINELKTLKNAFEGDGSELIVIYGRRRIGKTSLIKESIKEKEAVYFLAKRDLKQIEAARFRDVAQKNLGRVISGDTFEELLSDITADERHRSIVIIDEFPYLIQRNPEIVSEFQFIWDEVLKDRNVVLILTGSFMSVMKSDVLGYNSPLYGRGTKQMEIGPMNSGYLRDFLPHFSTKELIMAFGITDSIPYYMDLFNGKGDFWERVRNTILERSNPLNNDAELLLRSELREYNTYLNIIRALHKGKVKLGELSDASRITITNITKYLHTLERMNLIKEMRPLLGVDRGIGKRYRICDNYLRFWTNYIYPNRELVEMDPDLLLEKIKEEHNRYMGPIFEDFIRRNLRKILGKRFTGVGSWWHRGEEIDIIGIDEKNRTIHIGECKWKENVDGKKLMGNLHEKSYLLDTRGMDLKYHLFALSFRERDHSTHDLKDIGRAVFGEFIK